MLGMVGKTIVVINSGDKDYVCYRMLLYYLY